MFYVDNGSGIPNMPDIAEKRADTPQWFSEGKGNQQITWPGADFFNMWQAEGLNILAAAGMQPDKTKLNQLALAIKALIKQPTDDITDWAKKQFLAKDQNGGDIPDKQKFIENLGLTETVEQARNAVPSTRKVNGKALTTDITLTSGDIGALPVTGGKLNGPLGIGTDNALGGNSIVLGDNDTGLKQDGDGVLGIYANNARVGYIDNSGLHMLNDVYSGDAHLGDNGDIFGSVWGGWLNDFLNNNYNRKNTASLGDYGWVRDESTGFIMQWGTLGSSNGTYNFPREFPASCFAVFVTNTSQQGGAVDNAFGYPVSKSQFFAATKASTDGNVVNGYPVAWFAIGR